MTHIPLSTRRTLNVAAIACAGALLLSIPGYAQQGQGQGTDRQQDRQQQDRIGQGQPDRAGLPQGIKWNDEPADASDVHGVIDDVVGAAVIDGGFNDVVERFVDQDRNRFGEWMDEGDNREFTEFNAAAKRFQEAYKAKFNTEFDFDAEKALAGLTAVQGEVEDAQLAAANWPVSPMMGAGGADAGDQARVAGGAVGGDAEEQQKHQDETNEQGNIQEGRQVAIATIPAPVSSRPGATPGAAGQGQGQRQGQGAGGDRMAGAAAQGLSQPGMRDKALRVSLVNEAIGTWKIDVPNKRQPQQVYSDLAKAIDKLSQDSAQWPSDEGAVQHKIAYEVLCAVYGAKTGGEARQPGMTDRPARGAGAGGGAAGDDGMGN